MAGAVVEAPVQRARGMMPPIASHVPLDRSPMLVKTVIVLLLIAVVASLMTSMVFLVRDPSSRRRTLTGLKVRIALSVTLLIFVIVSYLMGWIHPHGLVP